MNNVIQIEDRVSRSRSKHEGESSADICDRLSRTRVSSQRQLPTDHDYAVPTREYQLDQSSPLPATAAADSVLEGQRQKKPGDSQILTGHTISMSGLAVTHFAVVHGVEGPHIQRPIPISVGFGAMIKVRLDAAGPRFTVYVQNQVVEDWEDDRLRTGGVGFLNEREERGEVSSVQISFPKGGRQ